MVKYIIENDVIKPVYSNSISDLDNVPKWWSRKSHKSKSSISHFQNMRKSLKPMYDKRKQIFSLIRREFKKSKSFKDFKTEFQKDKRKSSHILTLLADLNCNISILVDIYIASISLDEKADLKLSSALASFLYEYRFRSKNEGVKEAKKNEDNLQDIIDNLKKENEDYRKKESPYYDVYVEITRRLEENYLKYGKSKTNFIKEVIKELIDSKKYPDLNIRFKKDNSNQDITVEKIRLAYIGYTKRRNI